VIAKRVGLALGALLVSLTLLEVGTRLVHRVREGEAFPGDTLRERLAPSADPDRVLAVAGPPDGRRGVVLSNKVLHPYLWYVLDRDAAGERPVNRFGFPGPDPLSPSDPDALRVAIAGGSVALQLFDNGGDALARALSAVPAFAGRRVELVALTAAGYKQPQQLMALAWFLSLGARFDVVVNLDGFNEVVLPVSDNAPNGIHPAFPRSWDFYQAKALDADQIAHAAETRRLLDEQRRWRSWLGTGLASRSAFALTVLGRLDAGIAERIAEHDDALRAARRGALGFQATGPFVPYASESALFEELVAVWQSSSRQMHHLATASGAHYFHFLQPNQWVKDAKPPSPTEQDQLRVRGTFTPRTAVPVGYPLLGRAGAGLRMEGVAFHSLVRLFQAERRTVYRDTCCHFNRLGIETLAREIARLIAQDLEKQGENSGATKISQAPKIPDTSAAPGPLH